MNIDILELLIGQIPEAIFFSLFIILGKELKEKRLLFTFLMVLQYFIIANLFPYNINFQILYTLMTYIILKMLYKEKAQITDIFLFVGSLIVLLIFTFPCLLLNLVINNVYIVCAISKTLLFVSLFLIRKYIRKIYIKFYKHWNRNDNENRKIKSLTLRNLSAVIFNVLFFVTNTIIVYLYIFVE